MAVRAARRMLLAAWVALAAGPAYATDPAAARFPTVSDVRIGGDEGQTRFVADLSSKIDLRAFALANPYRVVLDLPQVTFRLPARTGENGRGLIKAFRYGLVMQGGSRIVLDLAKPARIDKSFVLEAANGQPARLVLDLAAVDKDAFMRGLSLENRAADVRRSPPPLRRPDNDPRPLIVIDPGHGGIDNGTTAASGVSEKTIVLDFGLLLRDKLEQAGRYRVVMTRTDDTFIPLSGRVDLARERQAALFISIHADALPRGEGTAQGASIYTLAERASDAEAARLAELENKSDAIAGVDLAAEPDEVADILIDLAQRETKTFSMKFAHLLAGEMRTATRMHKQPLRSAGFRVLRAPDVPSVLIELGFVSNRLDLKALTSDTWRTRTAESIVASIDAFFNPRLAGNAGRN